jgi:hypothetical protein
VPADYDGTGKLDLAVYESSNANWIIQHANGNVSTVAFGWAGVDVPIPGDYDGDGKADIAVFRPFNSQFFIDQSSNGVTLDIAYGAPNIEEAVPLDYDGDGRADIAVFAASTKQFFILDPLTFTQVIFQAGLTTNDTPGILPLTYRLRGMTLLV